MLIKVIIVFTILLFNTLEAAGWGARDERNAESIWFDYRQGEMQEGDEVPIYHEKTGKYQYETILHQDSHVIETYDTDRGEYNIYYRDKPNNSYDNDQNNRPY